MFGFLINLFGGSFITNLVNGVINAYKLKLDSANTTEAHAVDLAKAEILGEVATRQAAMQITLAEQGRWYTAMIRPAFAYPLAAYYATVVVCAIFHFPLPLVLPAPVGEWSGLIISSYFIGRSFEKMVRMFRR
jgi:hypothetical protein